MPVILPTPKEAEGTYLASPVVRYLLSLSAVPKENRCIFKDIWFHALLGAFHPEFYDIRPSILWGKGIEEDSPSKYWVLSALKRIAIGGSPWPNTLLVLGYRNIPSLSKGEGCNEETPDDANIPPDSADWVSIFDRLRRHLSAIAHVNISVPEFVALTVGRYVRFFRIERGEGHFQLVQMVGDPVYDLAYQNHAVQELLTFISDGREVVMISSDKVDPDSSYG